MATEINNAAIVIEPGRYVELTSASIYGGEELIPVDFEGNPLENMSGSIAISGTFQGSPAILTAGHCFRDMRGLGDIADSAIHEPSGLSIGEVKKVQYSSGQNGDYAFVKIANSQLVGTNEAYFDYNLLNVTGYDITGYATTYATGQLVYFSGNATGYTTFGFLESWNASYVVISDSISTCVITGMGSVSHNNEDRMVQRGDSGGIAFSPTGNGYCILGNISARDHLGENEPQSTYHSYFSPITYTVNAGFVPMLS